MATQQSNENDTILINIMYTGYYTNKNIGHEIINLYKTDNGENYLYISPYGYVTSGWDNRIKTILYARSAGKDKLEIIAKAEIEPKEQIITGMVECPKLKLSGNDKGLKNLKDEWKKKVKQNDKEYNKFINDLKNWESINRRNIKQNNNIDIHMLINTNQPKYHTELADTYKNDNYEEWRKKNEEKIGEYINLWEKSYDDWKHNDQISKGYFKWLIDNSKKHLQQIKEIYSKNIMYGGQHLCDIFKGNFGDESAIYFGYKVLDIKKPSKPIYIEYKEYSSKDKEKIKKDKKEVKASFENKENNTYHFKYAKIKNQSCSFYLNVNRIENFERFKEELDNEEFNVEINILEESKEHNKIEDYDKTLITLMGKQNDELSYSNMLAYYLNDKDIFKKFAEKTLDFKGELSFENTFEIKREYQNIDLLIDTDDDVFIIENKIKSGINGEKYDPYNGTYSNQLIKYCDIVDEDEVYKSKKNKHFYIFKPNYSDIDLKRLKDVDILEENLEEDNNNKGKNDNKKEKKYIKLTNEQKEKIEKWKIKNYLEIYKFFEDKEKENEEILKNKNLLEQFVKALSLHIDSNENIIEQEMEYKFRQAIEKAKK